MGYHFPAFSFPGEELCSFHYPVDQAGHFESRGHVLTLLQGLRGGQRQQLCQMCCLQ